MGGEESMEEGGSGDNGLHQILSPSFKAANPFLLLRHAPVNEVVKV